MLSGMNKKRAYINTLCFLTGGILGVLLVANQTTFQTVCDYFGVENATLWIGFFSAAFYIGMVAVSIVSGEMAERTGKRNVIIIFCFVILAGSLVLALSMNTVVSLIGFLLLGCGFSAVEGLINGMLVDENPGKSSRILNLTYVFFSAGAILSPLLVSNYINGGGDWHNVYYITAALYAVFGVLFLFAKTTKQPAAVKEKGMVSVSLFKNKYFVLACLAIFVYMGAESGATNWTPNIFASTEFGAYSLAVFWAATGLSRFIASSVKNGGKERFMLFVYSVISVGGLLGVIFLNAYPVPCLISFFAVGFGLGPLWPSFFAMGTDASGKYTGAGSGVVLCFSSLGGAVLSLLIGLFSGFEILWLCVVFVAVILVLLVIFNNLKKKELK